MWDQDFSEYLEGRPVVVSEDVFKYLRSALDDDTEVRWSFGETPVASDSPQHRILTADMKVGDSNVGTLFVIVNSRHRYTRHHLSLLSTVASNVAGAIAAAEMHARSMQLAETRIEWERAEAESRELQRVATAKSDFLTTVSHELRTPLTSILAFADMLKRNKLGNLLEKQERQLGIIQRSGRRLAVLIDDLLDELDETVVLGLGLPTNASLGLLTSHTATITDNDAAPLLQFELAKSWVTENQGTVVVRVCMIVRARMCWC
jgi:signal transduction histidine kinase